MPQRIVLVVAPGLALNVIAHRVLYRAQGFLVTVEATSSRMRVPRRSLRRRMYFRLGLVVVGSLVGFGCGDAGSGSAGETTTSTRPGAAVYLARPDDQWTLKEAYNPLPENTLTRSVEPSLDWAAEYEAPPTNSPRRVRLSGHSAGVDQVAAELKGFTLEPAMVGPYDGMAGVSSDPIGPSVVVFGVRANYSVMVLSYELPVEALLAWSDDLKTVTESEWTETGGRIER